MPETPTIKQHIQDTIDLIVRLRVELEKLQGNKPLFTETIKLVENRIESLRETVLETPK